MLIGLGTRVRFKISVASIVRTRCVQHDDEVINPTFPDFYTPKAFMRDASVVGLMPSNSAAPSSPDTLPLVSCKAARMLDRSRLSRSDSV